MTRRCSHCGHNGHNSRTCAERGVRLFGVRLMDVAMRKSASMGNLNNYGSSSVQPTSSDNSETAAQDGYVSDGLVQTSSNARERKKGVPWTEEEHRMFLVGLHKLGKGDWRGISRNYVQTRTPTQVASHAQKYFIRQNNLNKRKRRSSLFDIVSDPIQKSSMSEDPQKPMMETSFSPPNCYPPSFMDGAQTSGGCFSATPPYCQGPALMRGGIPPPSASLNQYGGSPFSFSLPSHQHFLSMAAVGSSKASAGNEAGEVGIVSRSEAPIRPAPQKPIPIPAPRRPTGGGSAAAAGPPLFSSSAPVDHARQSLGALGFAPVHHHPAILHSFPVLPWSHYGAMTATAEPQRSPSGLSPPQQETKICRPTAVLPFTACEGKKDALSAPFLSWQESLGLSPPASGARDERPSLPPKLLDRSPRSSAFHASSAFSSSSSSAISAV